MIRFDLLERRLGSLHESFINASPFPHVIIDDFADAETLQALVRKLPEPGSAAVNKSRNYMFAKNKFEKSYFRGISPECSELYDDLVSERFQAILQAITGQPIFIDQEFHGGGLHQGGSGSFLDMHADFNYHPLHRDWFRNINAILYLNEGWQTDWKGELKLRHAQSGAKAEIEPLFNRCLIMFTRDYTLHGYDTILFPPGQYRKSVAIYGYTPADRTDDAPAERSTVWYPEQGGVLKRLLGRSWPTLVKYKSRLIGSGTARNR